MMTSRVTTGAVTMTVLSLMWLHTIMGKTFRIDTWTQNPGRWSCAARVSMLLHKFSMLA